jgi:predicted MFS family arabinose efflux permease
MGLSASNDLPRLRRRGRYLARCRRPKYAATNYGFLYIAQGVGSILGGPAAAFLKQTTGSWTSVFIAVAALDAITALLAITMLRRLRQRHFATE